ncbi:cyclic nucleotide-gated cation channel beta-1-like isoform X2 [Hypomesus transpacificus]|uniref:cyclic nucleotide-gated cation channel beta-1-like isoform X2 n=1 Tax=Hypomesus transpacificus TaxID=137520 RepID=UPI001F0761AF|nr:cyclic nucleotide-gated cation channel beta-1-like isoform X2 [Hypomesus transpacificus]
MSERRRIELQSDLLTFQRDQRLSRAVRLQWRWQELSERERRAQQQNKQLLQEFERAQDTLRDMVARTAAMNTIRVEYEKYLDDNYPRWQQELKEKTLSAQRKQHLKESIRRMEEKTGTGSPISAKAPLSQAQVPQTQNGQLDCSSHSFQSSWLTHARYQLASPHTMLSFNPKSTQFSHHTLESLPPPPHFHPFHPPQPQPFQYPHPSSIPIQPQTVTQQSSTMWAPQGEYPLDWAGRVAVFPSRTQFGYQSSMAGPSISDPQGWAVVEGVGLEVKEGSPVARIEGESSDGHRPRGNDQSHELDIKPVRLSSGHGESSECSRASGRASGESDSRTRRTKKEQKEGRVKQSSVDSEETGLSSGRSVVGPDVEASASGAHSSQGDDATPGGGSTRSRRSAGLSVKQPKKRREKAKSKGEDTGSPVEDPGSQLKESPSPVQESERPREESESLGGESGSVSVKLKGCEEEYEETEGEQESLGVEGGTTEEKEVMEEQNGDDEENSERVKEEGEEGEMDEESPRDEEEEEGRAEEEGREELDEEGQEGEEEVEEMHGETTDEREDLSDGEKEEEAGEGAEDEKEEEAGEGAEDEKEEDEEASAREEPVKEEESVEKEEQSCQEAEELSKEVDHEEERESDDSIILPKENSRPAENRPILAEEEEAMIGDDHQGDDDHGEDARLEKGYSWSRDPTHAFQDEHDDIESLLAPQVETQKKRETEKIAPNSKSKAIAGDLNSSSEEEDLKKKTAPSPVARNTESDDEFDDFYD